MKTTLCVIGTALALSATAPVMAQDAAEGTWAPWMNQTVETPAPRVRPVAQAVTRVVAQAPQAEVVSRPQKTLLRIDRFWVIGSFR